MSSMLGTTIDLVRHYNQLCMAEQPSHVRTHLARHGGEFSTFALVKAEGDMRVLHLETLVAISACLLQVKEDGYIDKGMRIEVALSDLHVHKHKLCFCCICDAAWGAQLPSILAQTHQKPQE